MSFEHVLNKSNLVQSKPLVFQISYVPIHHNQ